MRIQSGNPPGNQPPPSTGTSFGPVTGIGAVPWTREEQIRALEEFLPVFERRPIRDNQGGMRSVGLYNVWFLLRNLAPAFVIESGIWKGQSTWLIEDTLPGAALLGLDPRLELRAYTSPKAAYSSTDFLALDVSAWSHRMAHATAFFDDHQDVVPRLKRCRDLGIRQVILDDNYPEAGGNRHISAAAVLNDRDGAGNPAFAADRRFLTEAVETYWICPPVFDYPGPVTMEKSRITIPSLLGSFDPVRHSRLAQYHQDLPEYRWTTYIKLR